MVLIWNSSCPLSAESLVFFELENQSGYETSDLIKYSMIRPTNEELNMINSKNNCLFLSSKYLIMQEEGQLDITEEELKQNFFNANKFPRLNNILECGYGKITVKLTDGSYFSKNSCLLIPGLTKIKDQEDYLLFTNKG